MSTQKPLSLHSNFSLLILKTRSKNETMSAFSSSLQVPASLAPFPSTKRHKNFQIPLPKHKLKPLHHQLHSQFSFTPQRTFQCFSQRQSTEQEFKFERLFSNLNQATLKREPGTIFF